MAICPTFLAMAATFLVPLPLLKDKSDLVQVERAPKERPFELRYQNFSVIMSRSRRFCCITGVNIDGSAPFFRFKRPGWKTDPRIPKAAQIDGAEFYVPTVFDRGHMVRRLDPVWGTEGAGRLANADTHHYTNSCPQVHSFNDATWGDLEDWILSQERSRDSKGSVFTGPIFQESDPVYEGVKVPVAFYKIVAVVDDAKGQLSVTAFEMDQSDVMPPQPGAPRPEAPFDPGRFFSGSNNVVGTGGTFGPRFREAQGFRCFGGAASAEVPVERCPTASTLNDRPGGRAVGSLTLSPSGF